MLTDMGDQVSPKNAGLSIFTRYLQEAIRLAVLVAKHESKKQVGLRHLLWGLLAQPNSASRRIVNEYYGGKADEIARKILGYDFEFDPEQIQMESLSTPTFMLDLRLSAPVKDVLIEAVRLSKRVNAYYVGSEHVLLSALLYIAENKRRFPRAFRVFQLERFDLRALLFNVLNRTLTPFRVLEQLQSHPEHAEVSKPIIADMGDQLSKEEFFSIFTKDVLEESLRIAGENILFRRDYIEDVASGLVGYLTQNVLLVGPSGVGKTYIVYSLAQRIAQGKVPEALSNKRIYRVSLPEMIAVSRFPLDLEKRIMQLFNFAYGDDSIILFFDNMQYIFNPKLRGGLDLFGILKPLFESNKIQVIATIPDDVFSLIDDAAFMRLFSIVNVQPMSREETLEVLKMYISRLSSHIRVRIGTNTLRQLIELVDEYIVDGVLPYKALKFLDSLVSERLIKPNKEYEEIRNLKKQLKMYERLKAGYLERNDLERLEQMEEQTRSIGMRLAQLSQLTELRRQQGIKIMLTDVRNHLAKKTGLPLYVVNSKEAAALLNLEAELRKWIVAQEEAIKKVVYAVKRGRLNIVGRNRPWASFLFLGPTGVGKSELAKVLARYLFGDVKDRLIQIDMSEFMESHSVSRLIGSPPGYVGFEQGGYLTERIKENPYSVVLFDEIEKAADNVLNILLQILEDGHLTDSHGETVSFKNSIIILTSNIGAEEIFKDRVLGFYREGITDLEDETNAYESMREQLMKQLYKRLRPELINRLDDVIIFRTLTKTDAFAVLDVLLSEFNDRIKKQLGLEVKLTKSAKEFLVNKGFSREFGARALRRTLQNYLENSLVDYILQQKIRNRRNLKGVLTFSYDKKKKNLKLRSPLVTKS